MKRCLVCNKKAESDLCFIHKNNKNLKTKSIKIVKKETNKSSKTTEMFDFFLEIWKEKPHYCENCKIWLGNEARSYHFDHLLEKSKYPELRLEKENIFLTCLDCHATKTNGHYSEIVQKRINIVKEKFLK